MTVLIVDDEEGIRESLRDIFEDEGYEVKVACDGVEAMQLLSDDAPCVVFLDIIMPRMDGLEVWKAMKSDARLATVPVVITTSDPTRAPQGALTMRKPVDLDTLLSTVEAFCGPPH